MKENYKSRFNIVKRTEIKNEYILYVEDLKVNFKDIKESKRIEKNIINIRKQIKSLDKNFYKEKIDSLKEKISELNIERRTLRKTKETKNKEVLRGVTFGLRQGETLAIVGANGAGKTVLMETIFGFIPFDSGNIYLNLGEETYLKNLKHVGIQFQQSKFSGNLKTIDLIDSYILLYRDSVDRLELLKMLEIFGIDEYLNTKVDRLSGGQKQRLNLLLSIMNQPKIMILDEFITGLDVITVRKIVTYVNELKEKNNASMIIISHQPDEIKELSDRVLVLKDGKIVEETYVPEIIKKYGDVSIFVEENI